MRTNDKRIDNTRETSRKAVTNNAPSPKGEGRGGVQVQGGISPSPTGEVRDGVQAQAGAFLSLLPLLVMVGLIALMMYLFDGSLDDGYAQLAMLAGAATALGISLWRNYCTWDDFHRCLAQTMDTTAESLIIIMLIGTLSASWMLSGAVPAMICYGMQIIAPQIFLPASCLLCAGISLMTGSSWSCIATVGVALVGIGNALGMPLGWTAGAIISGAYFGDKISPLSDTTVLAASSAVTPLFTHIRYMLYTTLPSLAIACIVFTIAGLMADVADASTRTALSEQLHQTFLITPWALLTPVITIVLILMRLPAVVTLFVSTILACITALIVEPDVVIEMAGGTDSWQDLARGIIITCASGTHITTGDALADSIVETGGMAGMTNTLTLILCGIILGGAMMASGMLQTLTQRVLRWAHSRTGLVSATAGTGILLNVSTCDQYISIIMTGSIYRDSYKKAGYPSHLLSRTVEDSTTVTSVLIPWNSCGATQSAVLGIATLTYAPYCVFNYVSPLMTILVAALHKQKKNGPTPNPSLQGGE